jgi:hypothetical protein
MQHTQLVVVTQPPAEFYKGTTWRRLGVVVTCCDVGAWRVLCGADEGGKSNFMTMIVTTPSSFPLTFTIRLKASLYFESEKPVEVHRCPPHIAALDARR